MWNAVWEDEGMTSPNWKVILVIQWILYILGTTNTGSSNCVFQDYSAFKCIYITFTHYCEKLLDTLARSQAHRKNAPTEDEEEKSFDLTHGDEFLLK